jgi:hypothetical protein
LEIHRQFIYFRKIYFLEITSLYPKFYKPVFFGDVKSAPTILKNLFLWEQLQQLKVLQVLAPTELPNLVLIQKKKNYGPFERPRVNEVSIHTGFHYTVPGAMGADISTIDPC